MSFRSHKILDMIALKRGRVLKHIYKKTGLLNSIQIFTYIEEHEKNAACKNSDELEFDIGESRSPNTYKRKTVLVRKTFLCFNSTQVFKNNEESCATEGVKA